MTLVLLWLSSLWLTFGLGFITWPRLERRRRIHPSDYPYLALIALFWPLAIAWVIREAKEPKHGA